jgi:hypothetical protein
MKGIRGPPLSSGGGTQARCSVAAERLSEAATGAFRPEQVMRRVGRVAFGGRDTFLSWRSRSRQAWGRR